MKTPSTKRRDTDLRSEARKHLIASGHRPGSVKTIVGLLYALEYELKVEDGDLDTLVRQFIDTKRSRLNKTPPRAAFSNRPLQPRTQYDINVERAKAAQPKLWTPGAVGNGSEINYGYGRGT